LYPAEEEETRELQSAQGLTSLSAMEALRLLDETYEPLKVATARTLTQLALRHENHEFLYNACPMDTLISRLDDETGLSCKRDIASFLCSITATFPEGLKRRLVSLVRICNKIEDSYIKFMIIASVANCMCDIDSAYHLTQSNIGAENLQSIIGIDGVSNQKGLVSEIIRLNVNLSAVVGLERTESFVRRVLEAVIAPLNNSGGEILDEYGMKYIFALISESWNFRTLQRFFIHNLKGINWLCGLPLNQAGVTDLPARVSLLLSKAALSPDNHIALVQQGGLKLVTRLYTEFPLDEIVRLNVILIGCSICESEHHSTLANELLGLGFSEILRQACEMETHLEIVSRALDAWTLLASHGTDWGSGIITATTLLFSDSVEVKLKALPLVSQLITLPEQMRMLFGIRSVTETKASDQYFNLILRCLPGENGSSPGKAPSFGWDRLGDEAKSKSEVILLRILSTIARDTDPVIRAVIENSPIAITLYKLYPQSQGNSKEEVAEVIARLLLGGSKRFSRSTLASGGESQNIIDILAAHVDSTDSCLSALQLIAEDPLQVPKVCSLLPKLLTMTSKAGDGIVRSERLSGILKYICRESANPVVAKQLTDSNIAEIVFSMMRSQNTVIASNCLSIVHALLVDKRNRWLHLILRPSKIGNIVETLNLKSQACDIHALKCIGLLIASDPACKNLVVESCGFSLSLVIKKLMESDRLEFLVILSSIAEIPRVNRVIKTDAEFRARCFDNLLVLIPKVITFAHHPLQTRSDNVLTGVAFISLILQCFSDVSTDERMKRIASTILLEMNPLRMTRTAPSMVSDQVQLLKLILMIPLNCMRQIKNGFLDLAPSIFKARIERYLQAAHERQQYMGKDALSECLERFHSECFPFM
jgi:hypothetical protein